MQEGKGEPGILENSRSWVTDPWVSCKVSGMMRHDIGPPLSVNSSSPFLGWCRAVEPPLRWKDSDPQRDKELNAGRRRQGESWP